MTCQTNGHTSGYCDNLSFNGNNQITTPGFSYHAAGNMTAGNLPGAYTFDDQGHVTNESGSAITRNAYGWDVEEKGTGYQEEQVYDPQGNELGSWGVTRNNWDYVFIPLGARIEAVTSPSGCCGSTGTTFLHANHLDSTTMTDYAGDVAEDLLLYPWGNRWTYAGQLNDEHFAGLHNGDDLKESPARTYVSPIGRWLTPDPGNAGADPSNPQSWNAYSYALNNPTSFADPTGRDVYVCIDTAKGGQSCNYYSNGEYYQAASAQNAQDNGVTAPLVGAGQTTGSIMCGGQVCGTVQLESDAVLPVTGPVQIGAGLFGGLGVGAIEEGGEAGEAEGAGLLGRAANWVRGLFGSEAPAEVEGSETLKIAQGVPPRRGTPNFKGSSATFIR